VATAPEPLRFAVASTAPPLPSVKNTEPVGVALPAPALTVAANVVLPWLASEGDFPEVLADHLPPEDISAPMREVANALFSRDHNPAFYATSGLYQQGLLQIHHDFCLNARAGCAHCALAETLGQRTEVSGMA